MSTPKESWLDPSADCIKECAGDILSEEIKEKLFGLLMRVKREWENIQEPGPSKEI